MRVIRNFLSWLITGKTIDDILTMQQMITTLEQQVEASRDRAGFFEDQYQELKKNLAVRDKRIDDLITLLATNKEGPVAPPTEDPIKTLPMSWPRARRELERRDAEHIRSNDAQVPRRKTQEAVR